VRVQRDIYVGIFDPYEVGPHLTHGINFPTSIEFYLSVRGQTDERPTRKAGESEVVL